MEVNSRKDTNNFQMWWKWRGWKQYGAITTILAIITTSAAYFFDVPGIRQCMNSGNLDRCFFLGQTAWEWLKLLTTPALLTVGGFVANSILKNREQEQLKQENQQQDKRLALEKKIADDRGYQIALKDYLEQMSRLLLDDAWPEEGRGEEGSKIVAVAKALTIATLRELDGKRNSELLKFLFESRATQFISLAHADLSGINLSKTILFEVNLAEVKLISADLSHAELSFANFHGANLSKANLVGATLIYTNLQKTNLQKANLQNACLEAANLSAANLSGANLSGTDLNGANLNRAKLKEANFRVANLESVDLIGADLSSADLSHANIECADLRTSCLDSANLSSTNLQEPDFSNANLSKANFYGANLVKVELSGAQFDSALLIAIDLRKANNLVREQLAGENEPYLCGVALPSNITDVDPNRDCNVLPKILVDQFGYSFQKAQHIIERARTKKWD